MDEDTEYMKLPIEERCVHKAWKARVNGYEECKKKFGCIDDEKSPEWSKFLGLIKKFVIDSNVNAQEKGLEATLTFVENAACAGKTAGEVMNGIVNKCIAAPKAKTKDLAFQITLMFIEIEKHEIIQEELLKGTEAKNPKIVSGCINLLTLALHEFGSKVISIKPLLKKIPAFLEDRDKNVREEGKGLLIEIYRWTGPALKQQLNFLKPVQLTELEPEFAKATEEKAHVNRYLRSQKPKEIIMETATGGEIGVDDNEDDCEDDNAGDLDPYELIDPVDILSKIPKDFYDKVESKKWQERKEALEALENLTKNPKLESGDYGDIVRLLKKIISKDLNVVVVTTAGKCLTGLATGLKKRFHTYASACIPAILEKFREKKQTVVTVLREAADAIFLSINIEVILEDTLAALENKNPSVKAETAAFLARSFANTPPPSLNKKLLKAYVGALLKTLNEPDPTVRDNSADALGTAMKLVGEKTITPFLTDVDALKMAKIQECAQKAVILVKVPTVRKVERPISAPPKSEAAKSTNTTHKTANKRPNSVVVGKKSGNKKAASGSSGNNTVKKQGSVTSLSTKVVEKELSDEAVEELALKYLPNEILNEIIDANWKVRLSGVEKLTDIIKQLDYNEISAQVIVRILNKKPGFKDNNFQVLKLRLEIVKSLADNYPFSTTSANYCLMDIAEKLGDNKNSTTASDTLMSIADATNLELVANEVINFAFNQKNPKVQQESLNWLSNAILEFGLTINVKALMDNIKKAITATNPSIRSAAISLVATLYLYLGKPLLIFFENEKPALKQQIEQECDKRAGETPPDPKRGPKSKLNKMKSTDLDDVCDNDDDIDENQSEASDIMTRIDISNQMTEGLIAELSDKNWKVRNEGLQKLNNILNEAKFIKGSIGDLPRGLAPRLTDSNTKIAQAALGICETLVTAMGPPAKQYVRAFFPGFLQCLGDSKNWMRAAAISCINKWGDLCGYKEFFDGEMIGDALKSGSPILRIELWIWLSQKLPIIPPKQIQKEELMICIPHLYSNLEDRNSDVRKNAQEAVLGFMIHLSYESMLRQTEKLKPGSKNLIAACLEKTRPNLPMKPLPPQKKSTQENNQKTVKSGGAIKANSKAAVKPKSGGGAAANKTGTARKKDDDVIDTSPLLSINNLKHQRVIDEQKLKILKWNFTSPREDYVLLLKDLMSSAGVNKDLINNMFSPDFNKHLMAITSLTEDLQDNSKALVSNLDLILKWLTLRFFDTNPSVLLKGLDYLQTVFNILIDDGYHMLENEASSFIPYLIIKIGDPKDAVRNSVRALFKQIALVYPVSKLFSYVMEGLKSKNARQRTECLDQLGSLIENYGVSVCQPSPTIALRDIAKQIADRDNSVRNGALNCIVQAYFLEGDRIYKLIGQISEKDQSLLEERIKRASKNRLSKPPSTVRMSVIPSAAAVPTNDDIEPEIDDDEDPEVEDPIDVPEERNNSDDKIKSRENLNKTVIKNSADPNCTFSVNKCTPPPPAPPKVSGPFGLDMDFLKKLEENAPAKWKVPELEDYNWDPNETVNPMNAQQNTTISIISPKIMTKPTRILPVTSMGNKDENLERIIQLMASPDIPTALQALNDMESILRSNDVTLLIPKEDKFINSINMQLRFLQTYPLTSDRMEIIAKAFRSTFMVTLTFYETGILGKNVSAVQLKEFIHQMITILAGKKMESINQSEVYIRVANVIVVKTIDCSNHTTIICVLLKRLYECAESKLIPRYEELVMKCLWKIVKTMSNWSNDLDYDTILLEVHYFIKDYPFAWWKKRDSDMPLRTVKTILHSMTKVKGASILNHLTKINNPQESELKSYLNRLTEAVHPEDVSTNTKTYTKQKNHSKMTHLQLTEIFKKIGSKNQAQEGLIQLYDFKIQHPEADFQPFLVKSHQLFQEFIEQGLKDIDQARKSQMNNQYLANMAITPTEDKSSMDALQRIEKLRALEAKYHANGPNKPNQT